MKQGKVLPKVIDTPTVIKEKAEKPFEVPDVLGKAKLREALILNKSHIASFKYYRVNDLAYIKIFTNVTKEVDLLYKDLKHWWSTVLVVTDFMKSKNEGALRVRTYEDNSVIIEPLFLEG